MSDETRQRRIDAAMAAYDEVIEEAFARNLPNPIGFRTAMAAALDAADAASKGLRMSETAELLFTGEMEQEIAERLGFEKSDWLGDWWLPGGNPELTWAELIEWAVRILNTEATRVHYPAAYLDAAPVYAVDAGAELPKASVSGAKRVNGYRGESHDDSGAIIDNPPQRDSGVRFRLSGKDSSCKVEGSWWDWICFAHNILASENTKVACPALYHPELANDNY